jgi:hypothetical protein
MHHYIAGFLDEKDVLSLMVCSRYFFYLFKNSNFEARVTRNYGIKNNGNRNIRYKGKTATIEKQLMRHLIEHNELQAFQWFVKKGIIPKKYIRSRSDSKAFTLAAKNGRLEFLEWIHDTYKLTKRNALGKWDRTIRSAVENGQLKVLIWLQNTFNFKRDAIMNTILSEAASGGYLAIIKWLEKAFNLTTDNIKHDDNIVLRNASAGGYLDILKWLHREHKLAFCDIRTFHFQPLETAARGGYLNVVKWLCETFNMGILESQNCAFRVACQCGHLDIVQYICQKYELPRPCVVREYIGRIMNRGHINILKWLHKEYLEKYDIDIRSTALQYTQNYELAEVVSRGHLEVLKWLYGVSSVLPMEVSLCRRIAFKNSQFKVLEWLDSL